MSEKIKAAFFKVVDPIAEFCEKRKWITYSLVVASIFMLGVVRPILTPELSKQELRYQKAKKAQAAKAAQEEEDRVKLGPRWTVDGKKYRWCEPRGETVVCGHGLIPGRSVDAIFMTPPKEMFRDDE